MFPLIGIYINRYVILRERCYKFSFLLNSSEYHRKWLIPCSEFISFVNRPIEHHTKFNLQLLVHLSSLYNIILGVIKRNPLFLNECFNYYFSYPAPCKWFQTVFVQCLGPGFPLFNRFFQINQSQNCQKIFLSTKCHFSYLYNDFR